MPLRRAAVLLTASTLLLAPAAPALAAGTAAPLEAEGMTRSGNASVLRDGSASAGVSVVLRRGAGVSSRVGSTAAATGLRLRLRSASRAAPARVLVEVDGRRVAALTVTTTAWRSYPVAARLSAGNHRVVIASSASRTSGSVHVDRLVLVHPARAAGSAGGDAYGTAVLGLVNVERRRAGLPALAWSPCAAGFAQDWSQQMARTGTLAHRADLGVVLSRCDAVGVGENIAYGNVSARQMMEMWMASAGHRASILNAGFTHLGVGAVRTASGRVYGTQNFLRRG